MSAETIKKTVSIIVPVYNEEASINPFCEELFRTFLTIPQIKWEVIFVNDGSKDSTQAVLEKIAAATSNVSVIEFSRNFGKEAATSAGLAKATGDAAIMIDADLQHPPKHLAEFIEKWQAGADVVIGVRKNDASNSYLKRIGSRLYYKIINTISDGVEIIPRATDYRLLDRCVIDEFVRLTEHNRMTRGLVDWLGFQRDYIYFETPERQTGEATYTTWKLIKLAVESLIAHSLLPLRLAGYLGVVIIFLSGSLGVLMLVDRYTLIGFNFSGPAILADIILFLVGIVLVMLGLLSYYIAHIFAEVQNRPLYVVRNRKN